MMITKLFGQSSIQEYFNKSDSLKWVLEIKGFDYFEYIFGESVVNKKNLSSGLIFDFNFNMLTIDGDISRDAFQNIKKYKIINKSNQGLEPEYTLTDENNVRQIKLSVKRKYLHFESLNSNWNCKVQGNIIFNSYQSSINSIIFENNNQMNTNPNLSSLFPNFITFFNESSQYLQNVVLNVDSPDKLEYRVPIITFGQTMGYDFYTIERNFDNSFLFYQSRVGKNGSSPITSSKIQINNDQPKSRYNELLQEIMMNLMPNPRYRSIATSGF
jgi:hypothetical protein